MFANEFQTLWKSELSKSYLHLNLSLKVSSGILDILVPSDVYHVVLQHIILVIEEAYVISIPGRWARHYKPLITLDVQADNIF